MKLPKPKLPKPKLPKTLFPAEPPPGPTRPTFWRSPLRGPWLTSMIGSALLPMVIICAVTGFLSQASYNPSLGANNLVRDNEFFGIDLYFFSWPTHPSYLYALTQGLHIASGLIGIPLLLAKLWSVMPKLFEWPPIRSISHLLERASLALLVGGSLFVFFTGLLNIQLYYPWPFRFLTAHYYGAFIFLAAFIVHVSLKMPLVIRTLREKGVVKPLRDDLAHTVADPYVEGTATPLQPNPPTISRRALLGTVAAASIGAGFMAVSSSIGGPLRSLGFLSPRSTQVSDGPNGFQVNKTAVGVKIKPSETGDSWRLKLAGEKKVEFSRDDLLAMPQHTYDLPIACVEGWSTTQKWSGVRLRDLAAAAGVASASEVLVESLQKGGSLREATLSSGQIADERSLLALKVNGVDLSPDHGFPARVIVPAAPGVHCTKWVSAMQFQAA